MAQNNRVQNVVAQLEFFYRGRHPERPRFHERAEGSRGHLPCLRQVAVSILLSVAILVSLFAAFAIAQQADVTTPPLEISTTTLPRSYLHQAFRVQLEAQGGVPPLKWILTEGVLPTGLTLQPDGMLGGTPAQTGEFSFTATVSDSGKPPYQRSQKLKLKVVAPLLAQWGKYPMLNGQRVDGSVLVSNQTEHDFDLTMIVLAVNETGRATAIGYQHFSMKRDTAEMEIPFGDNLAAGSYGINVDVVAEVAATNSIYRERLATRERIQVPPQQ